MLTSRAKKFSYVFSIFLCTTYISSPVMGADISNSKWQVKQVVSEKNKFLPYCTLTRQYDNMVLAIAKNDKGISNIAIESINPLIKNSGKSSINIILKTELIKKTVSANPLTESAILIKLQKPDEIDNLIHNINSLTMTSNDFNKELFFKMDNIDEAVENLNLCLSKLKINTKDDNATDTKYIDIKKKLARKDAKIEEMQKSLNLKQKQIENAPLYQQAQKSTLFKNLNIANLDLELMKKQEDLNRQSIGLTEQQEWMEKESLRVKKIHSPDGQSNALKEAQLQIQKLENDYSQAKEHIADLQAKQRAETIWQEQKKEMVIDKPVQLIKPIEQRNISWNQTSINIAKKHDIKKLAILEPSAITPSKQEIFINKLTSIDNITKTDIPKTYAPISLKPIPPKQEIMQIKKPIEVERTYIISAPEPLPKPKPVYKPINLIAPKQHEFIHLKANTMDVKPKKKEKEKKIATTYITSSPKIEPYTTPKSEPIHLHASTPETIPKNLDSFQGQATPYIKPEIAMIKEELVILKKPISLNNSNIAYEQEPELELSPIPFTTTNIMREENIATIPKPVTAESYNNKKPILTNDKDSQYGDFLEKVMNTHRKKNY